MRKYTAHVMITIFGLCHFSINIELNIYMWNIEFMYEEIGPDCIKSIN